MDKLTSWLVTLIGVLLVLPMLGITQIGTLTSGVIGWLVPIAVLVIGIKGILEK